MLATYFNNVTYNYDEKPILENFNVSIEMGKHVIIKGKNGSGKSTFAKLAAGLIEPTSGDIEIFGENTKTSADKIRCQTGIVLQDFEMQIFHSVVEDDIAFGPENLKYSAAEIKKSVAWAANICHIEHLLEQEIFSLSGGQKQMVAFAGAIATQPRLLILDEASSHLDKKFTEIFYTVLKELKRNDTTIIEINHLDTNSKFVDEIIYL